MTTCTENCAPGVAGGLPRSRPGLLETVRKWLAIQQFKATVRREREQLASCSEATLRDLGITRAEANAEARRRDLPAARLQQLLDQDW